MWGNLEARTLTGTLVKMQVEEGWWLGGPQFKSPMWHHFLQKSWDQKFAKRKSADISVIL
jgi:hypothetical protein